MTQTSRAYSVLSVKDIVERADDYIVKGVATTPTSDRADDVVEPLGGEYRLPLPMLWQHDSEKPIGNVIDAKPTKSGIPVTISIPKVKEQGVLRDRIEEAVQSIRYRLVTGLSIGFRALENGVELLKTGGLRFTRWEWLELSLVTVPANAEATITNIKKFDTDAPAATGNGARPSNANPPATGKSIKTISTRPKEGQRNMTIKNVGQQIADLEKLRKEKADAMEAIQAKSTAEARTKNADERTQFNELRDALKALDDEIADLKDIEAMYAPSAKPVEKSADTAPKPYERMTPAVKKPEEKGLGFARLAKVKAVARLDGMTRKEVAEKMYGRDSETYHIVTKSNEVEAGRNASGNWASDLVSSEGAIAADFAEYLRPSTIIGKFGTGGIPALRQVPFRKPLILGTGGGTGYWVGEASPKPMTAFDFDRSTLDPLKCATIAVLSMENIRDSSPSSDMIVRDELRRVLVQLQDVAFIDPTNAGTANVKPASVTNGTYAIPASSYTDENDVIQDVRSLVQVFINQNNPANQAVLLMEEGTAMAAGLILTSLGNRAFPGLGMRGGMLLDLPVITSESVPSGIVAIVNASDIFFGDDGDITVDMSTEASLEMKSVPTQDPTAPGTGASLVSLWQNNLVGFRAERTVNWKRRRPRAAAYLTGVAWGGALTIS